MGIQILENIFNVFDSVFTWMIAALGSVVDIFVDPADSELTFFGVLALVALAISVFFLLIRVVQNFLHFRS